MSLREPFVFYNCLRICMLARAMNENTLSHYPRALLRLRRKTILISNEIVDLVELKSTRCVYDSSVISIPIKHRVSSSSKSSNKQIFLSRHRTLYAREWKVAQTSQTTRPKRAESVKCEPSSLTVYSSTL